MDWGRWRETWPNADTSRFEDIDGLRWHAQTAGEGPAILLLHGAGASTHSMAALFDDLIQDHEVTALDLPGHGFTDQPSKARLALDAMSADLHHFLVKQSLIPSMIIAHSASAAIAMRLCLDHSDYAACKIISINGALGNFRGIAGTLFPLFAKLLAAGSFTANIFASMGQSRARVANVLRSTGSQVSDENLTHYHALMSDPRHVGNTLSMMANWSLDRLLLQLPQLKNEVLLIAGDKDQAVPPDTADVVARKLPNASVVHVPGYGHLLHEEDPSGTLRLIRDALA